MGRQAKVGLWLQMCQPVYARGEQSMGERVISKPSRKVWVMADEDTEFVMYERQPDLFSTHNPELVIIEKETQVEEHQKYQELARVVKEAIDTLPKEQQAILYLRYFNDGVDAYTAKDIAAKLEISVRSYFNYLNEAKRVLRGKLEIQPIVIEYLKIQRHL
jgi:RNA polymerase sigma factor (sigma-70 family)